MALCTPSGLTPSLRSKPVWAAMARSATEELAAQQFAALPDQEALGILQVACDLERGRTALGIASPCVQSKRLELCG